MARTVPSAADMAKNWEAGIAAAGQKYKDAINRVNVNPAAAAATPEAMAAYLAGVQNSVTSGKRARALAGVDMSFWKSQTTSYGVNNYAGSAQKGKAKYAKGVGRMGSAYQDASNAAHAIQGPKGKARAMARVSAVYDVLTAAASRG